MNGNEKYGDNAIRTDSKALKWFENFWYHYKWPVLIVCFFVIVFAVCTAQMCNKKSYDISMVYAGPYQIAQDNNSDIKSVMNFIIPEDFDGDGEKTSNLITYLIYTKEQIEKTEAQSSQIVDRAYISNENQNFFNYTSTEAGICFLDPSLYQTLKDSDRLVSVTATLGYSPEGLIDDNGVRLSETEIYKEYAVIREMPADTVVCMLRKQLTKKENAYSAELETFKALLSYNSVEK